MKIKHLITFTLLTLFLSCKTSPKNKNNNNVSHTVDTSINKNNPSILNIDSTLVANFTLNPLAITTPSKKYFCKYKSSKHKFFDNGKLIYEVKLKESGFKLRNANSKLLWKVKIYPDKIKISDNEENNNPYIIKNYEGKVKIKRNDEEIFKVKFKNNVVEINEKPSFIIQNQQLNNYAFAILAIEEIPQEQRIFILTELLNKI